MSAQVKEILSETEAKVDRWRRRAGFGLAPLVFVVLWWLPLEGVKAPAQQLLAVLGLVVTLWICESIPLPATALFGPALCVVCGLAPAKEVFKGFADPVIFLFLGSFLLAEGMFRHGLNRRIAFGIMGLRWVGESAPRLLLAFGGVTAFLSMWMSNTTTTAMMFPIGLSILSEMARRQSERTGREVRFTDLRYGTGLMLTTAFASSIGGMATPVGTPPNLIGLGMLQKYLNVRISFFEWMVFAVPLALVLTAILVVLMNRLCPAEPGLLTGAAEWIRAQRAKLGPLSAGETNVLAAFGVTIVLWLLPGLMVLALGADAPLTQWLNRRLPEGVVALLGATMLFVLPARGRSGERTLGWEDARRIDWGTLLLFGGGLALGDLIITTGLGEWLGKTLAGVTHTQSTFGLTILFAGAGILATEAMSNTACATMMVPVAILVAQAAGANPVPPALAACLGASLAFMLPVSTPPNAIVYGSGCVPLIRMVKYGLLMDLAGFVAVVVVVLLRS
jgi:sodium-dependent dicarboxylate transporter 2/3/5